MRNILIIPFLALMVACHTQSKISKQEVAVWCLRHQKIVDFLNQHKEVDIMKYQLERIKVIR